MYEEDLAYVQAMAFGDLAAAAGPQLAAQLSALPIGVKQVVDLGCGAGLTTKALVDAGFSVVAVDASEALLAFARLAAPGATFVRSDLHALTIPYAEAILAIGEPLTYHEPHVLAEGVLQGFFHKASNALVSGGQLIFDLIIAEGPSLAAKSHKSGDDWAILWETIDEPATFRLTRRIEVFRRVGEQYRRSREVHHVRLFSESAVCGWLELAGFRVEVRADYGGVSLALRRRAFYATKL